MTYEWTAFTLILDRESKTYGFSKARRSSRNPLEDPMVVKASTNHNISVMKFCNHAQSLKLVWKFTIPVSHGPSLLYYSCVIKSVTLFLLDPLHRPILPPVELKYFITPLHITQLSFRYWDGNRWDVPASAWRSCLWLFHFSVQNNTKVALHHFLWSLYWRRSVASHPISRNWNQEECLMMQS